MQWHSTDSARVVEQLGADPARGLSSDEAARRLAQHGPNELTREQRTPPWKLLLAQFGNTLVVILLAATVLSAFLGEVIDAAIILVIVLFCAILGFVQEYRAGRALDALRQMLASTITVLRDGAEARIPAREVVPGDVLLLEAGDRIPADGRVLEAHSLRCDEAPLTGESFPVEKAAATLPPATPMADRVNVVFTGTTVAYGRGKAVVTGTGMETEFGKIAQEVSTVKAEKTPLEKRTEEIGRWLGIAALVVCAAAVIGGSSRAWSAGALTVEMVVSITMFAIALAVAAVPEALAAIVTGALAVGMHEMARRNALVRRMPVVETLGCTTVICTDKTGTLTKGEMTVRRVHVDGGWREVGGTGYAPAGQFEPAVGERDAVLQLLLQGAVLCNDASLVETAGRWSVRGDPTEGALVVLARKAGLDPTALRAQAPRLEEFPFSSERKRMTTVHRMPDGRHYAFSKGAPEVLLRHCASELRAHGSQPLDEAARAAILERGAQMADNALRVLAIACREVDAEAVHAEGVEEQLTFLGLVGMMDPPREEAIEAVRTCARVRIRPVMITGDHQLTARAVAAETGIWRPGDRVLTGEDLAGMSDAELEASVEQVSVYARVSPTDKLKIVRAWKQRGHIVAMTGDGVNDAPALKHADIGIAMGISGTEVAKEAADMVLADDNFATIVKAIERGRWIYDNIRKYLTYLLRANLAEIVVLGGVVIVAGPELLPLLPAAILYINLASDGLPALALGLAPPDRDIMERPPRDPKESIFSGDVRLLVLLGVLIECPILLWVYLENMGDIEVARTRIFLVFVFVELLIAMCFRSLRYSVFEAPPHKWLLIAIGWEAVLLAGLLQFGAVREAFGIRMPTLPDLSLAAGIALLVAATIELSKWWLRRRAAPLAAPAPVRAPVRAPAAAAPPAPGQLTRILVPVSASHGSRYAVHEIVRRFIADGAMEVHLLNVRAPMNWYAARFIPAKNRRDWHRSEAEEVLQPCREVLDRAGVPYAVHVELGDQAECIPRLARRLHCDRVLVGTARAKSLTRFLEDAEIRRVVERCSVPVEVVAGDQVARWERYGIPAALGAVLALWAAASE